MLENAGLIGYVKWIPVYVCPTSLIGKGNADPVGPGKPLESQLCVVTFAER